MSEVKNQLKQYIRRSGFNNFGKENHGFDIQLYMTGKNVLSIFLLDQYRYSNAAKEMTIHAKMEILCWIWGPAGGILHCILRTWKV